MTDSTSNKQPLPNPFGNYSLREAQQQQHSTISGTTGSIGSNTNTGISYTRPRPIHSNPFQNYNFKDAQQQQQPGTATVRTTGSSAAASPMLGESYNAGGNNTSFQHLRHEDGGGSSGGHSIHNRHIYIPETLNSSDSSLYHGHDEDEDEGDEVDVSTTIEEHAIRMLYEDFRDRASRKIEYVAKLRLDREPSLSRYLDPGADTTFDRALDKLGMLARRRPRVLIELLLVWRKTIVDTAGSDDGQPETTVSGSNSRSYYIVKERRSLASVYILCRALSAVVGELDAVHLEGELGDRLEELVFSQVKQVNPVGLRQSQNRRDIQGLYAGLIGRISELRFASMSDRFIAELERIPMVAGAGNDERVVMLLHNMRSLKLRVFPIDALEDSSAFLLSCAKFYSRTSGSLRLKHAWANLLTELIMPLAAVVDAEANFPELVQALDIIYAKVMKMAVKVRHVNAAFPLAAAVLCTSRKEVFHQRWLSLLELCIQRLKDKQFRKVSMDAILRMLWVYLFRYPEAHSVVVRRIDSLSRIFFPATKLHAWPKTVPPSAFVYFLTCAACYNFDFAMRQLLSNMLQLDSGWPGTNRTVIEIGPIMDTLNPARVSLAFQALVSVAAIANDTIVEAAAAAAAASAMDSKDSTSSNNGSKDSHRTASGHCPPFPGIGQLSGLDYFDEETQSRIQSKISAAASNKVATGNRRSGRRGNHLSKSQMDGEVETEGKAVEREENNSDRPTNTGSNACSSNRFGTEQKGSVAYKICQIEPANLPDTIRRALAKAIDVMTRYFNALNPAFSQFVLADERLWRLTRTVPPFSTVVLTGSTFTLENTARRSALAADDDIQGDNVMVRNADDDSVNGEQLLTLDGNIGGHGNGNGETVIGSKSRSSDGGGGNANVNVDPATAVVGGGTSSSVIAKGGSDGNAADGIGGNISSGVSAAAMRTASIRQTVDRYPIERQTYVDLMATYTRNVSRVRLFGESKDTPQFIETIVQNTLNVDQSLAADSRACLMDLLSPQQPILYPTRSDIDEPQQKRLTNTVTAVTRATQLLRAVDERYSEVLVGGMFTKDWRSRECYSQPGDPLFNILGSMEESSLPNSLVASGHSRNQLSQGVASQRYINHMAKASTASTISDIDDAFMRQGLPISCSAPFYHHRAGGEGDIDSDLDAMNDSSTMAATVIDVKTQMAKSTSGRHMNRLSTVSSKPGSSSGSSLDGGFLHMYLDLLDYLQQSLCQCHEAAIAAKYGSGINLADSIDKRRGGQSPEDIPAIQRSSTNNSENRQSEANNTTTDSSTPEERVLFGTSMEKWAKLVNAVEANAIALLCSSRYRVRHLAVDVLYQAGILRRIMATIEPAPLPGTTSAFSGIEPAYDVLNVLVPPVFRMPGGPLVGEFWNKPFGEFNNNSSGSMQHSSFTQFQKSQKGVQPLARLAASGRDAETALWAAHFPAFITRANRQVPEVMLVARTLICQKLYQMQPLMCQYADVAIKANAGMMHYHLRLSSIRVYDKSSAAAAAIVRADMVGTFGSLFLFAVASLPSAATRIGNNSGGTNSSFGETVIGSNIHHHSGLAGSGNSSRSRLAKTIARKLAPLKSSSRGNKQEQGVGLATIGQLVRMASVLLKSNNAPLRQQTAYALCYTPTAYLRDLMHELRPLGESLFDDGTLLTSHRNYLHVGSGGSGGIGLSGGSGRDSLISAISHGISSSPGNGGPSLLAAALGGSSISGSPKHLSQMEKLAHGSYSSRRRHAKPVNNSTLTFDSSDTEIVDSEAGTRTTGNTRGRRANSFDAVGNSSSAKEKTGNSNVGGSHLSSTAAATTSTTTTPVSSGGSANQQRRRRLRLSLAQIYRQVARQLDVADDQGHTLGKDEHIVAQLIAYVRETRTFLSESSTQWDAEHQPLRIHFCGLVEAIYFSISSPLPTTLSSTGQRALEPRISHFTDLKSTTSINLTTPAHASRSFTYETRIGVYQLLERWCGVGRFGETCKEMYSRMAASALEQVKDPSEREKISTMLTDERLLLETTSLRAMAILCREVAGYQRTGNTPIIADNISAIVPASSGKKPLAELPSSSGGPHDKAALFSWISDALDHPSPHIQTIGQQAVVWTINAGPADDPTLVRALTQLAYGISVASSVNSGLSVAAESDSSSVSHESSSVSQQSNSGGTATSGLGLVFGVNDSAATKSQPQPQVQQQQQQRTTSAIAFSTNRIILGYLKAFTEILLLASSLPSSVSLTDDTASLAGGNIADLPTSSRGRGTAAIQTILLKYTHLLLPLALYHLRSESHRIRRQALLLLRELCIQQQMNVSLGISCVDRLDELGPSIVCDIPAVATEATSKLTTIVVKTFASYSTSVILEITRQTHFQGSSSGRMANLLAIAKPWMSNIELTHNRRQVGNDSVNDEQMFSLTPSALGRSSLQVLQCLLYLTTLSSNDTINIMQGLWLELAEGSGDSRNIWLTLQHFTGLLIQSPHGTILLGFMRRIALFFSRSQYGQQLVEKLVEEAIQPTAAFPIDPYDNMPYSAASDMLPISEAWIADFPYHGTIHYKQPQPESLVSTGGLALYYLSAVSYEKPQLLIDQGTLSVLAPCLFSLANPERWVRDASRSILINLVAAERVHCATLCAGGTNGQESNVNVRGSSGDIAYNILDILRGDECVAGFGNAIKQPLAPKTHTAKGSNASGTGDKAIVKGPNPGGVVHGDPDDYGGELHGWSPMMELPRNEPNIGFAGELSRDIMMGAKLVDPAINTPTAEAEGEEDMPTKDSESTPQTPPSLPLLTRRSLSSDYFAENTPVSNGSSNACGGESKRDRLTLFRLVVQLSRLFGKHHIGCAQEWAGDAVHWTMRCPIRSLAVMALQVFSVLASEAQHGGALVITPTRQMILRLIDRLSNVIGDESSEISVFAETVLVALRHTAGLAARMCADDEDIKADLLATSLAVLRTTQNCTAYSLAMGIFERIFALVGENEELYYRRIVSKRLGFRNGAEDIDIDIDTMEMYQTAFLRGLEFAGCRERCFKLLRSVFQLELGEGDRGRRQNQKNSAELFPQTMVLALTAQLPSLLEDSMQEAIVCFNHKQQKKEREMVKNSSVISPATDEKGEMAEGENGSSSNTRRQRTPTFSSGMLGSSLGLMFGSPNTGSETETYGKRSPPPAQKDSLVSSESSTRLQLFRRRGQPTSNQSAAATATATTTTAAAAGMVRSPKEEAITKEAVEPSNIPEEDIISSQDKQQSSVCEGYWEFVDMCKTSYLEKPPGKYGGENDTETRQLLSKIAELSEISREGRSNKQHDGCLAELLAELEQKGQQTITKFGLAVVENGVQTATSVIAVLLKLLQPSRRAQIALKHLTDEQASYIAGGCKKPENRVARRRSIAVGGLASETDIRKICVCLRMLDVVLRTSSESRGEEEEERLRLDSAMMPLLRHLLGLLVDSPRPLSDMASGVLQMLMQRFDGVVNGITPAGMAGLMRLRWYETDADILVGVSRAALGRVVRRGMEEGSGGGSAELAASSNSSVFGIPVSETEDVSPEMPVLELPSEEGEEAVNNISHMYMLYESESSSGSSSSAGDDMMAELDEFDRELDQALQA